MSCPAQNASPAPVRMRTSVSVSVESSSSASSMSRCSCGLMALRLSGRLRMTQVIPPSLSILIVSYFLSAISFSPRWFNGTDYRAGCRCACRLSSFLRHPPWQGDGPLRREEQQHLAVGGERHVGRGGDVQVDSVAHDIDPAGVAQK